jgi:hypothetical protein
MSMSASARISKNKIQDLLTQLLDHFDRNITKLLHKKFVKTLLLDELKTKLTLFELLLAKYGFFFDVARNVEEDTFFANFRFFFSFFFLLCVVVAAFLFFSFVLWSPSVVVVVVAVVAIASAVAALISTVFFYTCSDTDVTVVVVDVAVFL